MCTPEDDMLTPSGGVVKAGLPTGNVPLTTRWTGGSTIGFRHYRFTTEEEII